MLMHMDGYMHQGSKLFLQGLSEMQLALWVRTGKPECISVDINTLVNLSFIVLFLFLFSVAWTVIYNVCNFSYTVEC